MSALTDTFSAIANAIRGKLGVQTTYTPTQMSSAIASIPTAKEEQTKSVTATTSAQTVTPDTGKVLSSVTVNPQVHSATYTPTGYSNANDMGAQNNYRYVDTSAYEPTSITPSNSSPVALAADTGYKPTESGYAIKDYNSIQPSNIPRDVASGDIVKISTFSAKIIRDTYLYDLTPSDSDPVLLSGQQNFHVTGSSGVFQGCAIASQPASKTPSDTSPASVTSGSIIRPSSAGYLVKTVSNLGGTPDKTYSNDSAPSSGSVDISVTKKPRYIILGIGQKATTYQTLVGIIDVTKSKGYRMGFFSSAVSGDWTNYTSYFPTISSSKVTYSYAAFNGSSRVKILIYY
jgi:hypothetical protein